MNHYRYLAKDACGYPCDGHLDAENEQAAVARLGGLGYYPFQVTVEGSVPTPPPAMSAPSMVAARRPPSRAFIIQMTQALADLLEAGVTLLEALTLVRDQARTVEETMMMAMLGDRVRDGASFAEALAALPACFPPVYVAVVRAGEMSGTLEPSLGRLADLLREEEAVRQRVQAAVLYPALIAVVGIGTVSVLLVGVIPTWSQLFAEAGQALPWPTRLVLGVSRTVTACGWWCGLAGLGALGAVMHAPWRMALADAWQRWLVRLPWVGTLVRRHHIAQWAAALGLLLAQGVPMLQALEAAAETMSHALLRADAHALVEAVRTGQALAEALRAQPLFPPFVADLVAVGERSGTVARALTTVGEAYRRQADRATHLLLTLLEPSLILTVGAIVGLVVIAMLLPVFQLETLVR